MGLSRNEKVMVIVLLAGTLLVVLNQTFLSPALPTIMADLAVDATTVQWLTSGYALVEAVVIPLNAFLVGRFSTRRLFMGGLSMFALGSLVAAAAPAFPVLLLGRVMQACGTGMVMPMVFTLIILLFPRERRGSAMGIVGAYGTAYIGHITSAEDLTLGMHHAFNEWFVWMSIIKSLFFAFIIASVSSYFGYTVEGGSVEVGEASTDAVVCSSVLILFSDVFLTQMLS